MDDFSLTPPVADDSPRYGELCCVECFEHEWLRHLIEVRSRQQGTCEFCGTDNVSLIEVSYLSKYFQNMTTMYSPVSSDNTILQLVDPVDAGEFLDDLIQEDWEVFSDRLFVREREMDLLEAILNARYTEAEWRSREREEFPFDPAELYTSRQNPGDFRLVDAWDEHKERLLVAKGRAAAFAIGREDFERISVTLPPGTVLYRARVGFIAGKFRSEDKPYQSSEIGAPPASKAGAGRANRKGQVVMYCADQKETAVAEVRPARGNVASLGVFHANRELKVLDLVMPPPPLNPFTEPDLALTVELYELFLAFGKDLATPLRRSDDVTEYLPSQNLSDSVRLAGFDGIRYPSAMNRGGSNLVLFEPACTKFINSQLVEVTDVVVAFSNV